MPRRGWGLQEVARIAGTVPSEWQAVQKKLPALKAHAAVTADIEAQVKRLVYKNFLAETPFERRALQFAKAGVDDPQVEQFRWLPEELRVNLFAQELKTPVPVSVRRLSKQWEGMRGA